MEVQADMKRIRVLLLDDHILFREGLSRLLQSEPDFEIVGVCGTSAEAIEILSRGPVDVVLLDFDLGEDHGSQLISAARGGGYSGKILMVTAGMSAAESSIALKLGASGIFLKHSPPDALVNAIRLVVSGVVWVDERVIQLIADAVNQPEDQEGHKRLTEREEQVLQAVFEGLTNKETAARLGVTEGAVKATLQHLFQKTGVRTRSQLVRVAIEGSRRTGRRF
ncbi:MAG: response regulator transcription factor [Candidatus Methylomirabilis oxygeniifera]|uniref:Two component transcriptional regulator, LuxR family n=1 Tax=Methylomirabilis oxygeniifera TaxID=671143 RepID=D5MFR1_METO1|nr:MAG: response regulator transcription factor [Candidatus Methylomirabilis oxyfera]CBE68592.1 Two component transcriptional regulator, LuxR family [Candidatus Methylomirabilis oxyfera]